MLQLCLLFSAIIFTCTNAGGIIGLPTKPTKKVSAAVKDTPVNGIEGINLIFTAPFVFNEYVIGMTFNFAELGLQIPGNIFILRDFGKNGHLSVDAQVNVAKNKIAYGTVWSKDKFKVMVGGDNVNLLSNVGGSIDLNVPVLESKVNLASNYAIPQNILSGKFTISTGDIQAYVSYDTGKQDPVITLEKIIDNKNVVIPSLSLKTDKVNIGWLRKWKGGSLKTTLYPQEKAVFVWKDNGVNGAWTTQAAVPLNDRSKTKVSFNREFLF